MSLEIWQAIPAVNKNELHPILSTLSDNVLEEQVVNDLSLSDTDSLFSVLHIKTGEFQTGRFVVVSSLRPEAMQKRVDTNLTEMTCAQWFQTGGLVVRLTEQQSQGCYGGWRRGFALQVFGQ